MIKNKVTTAEKIFIESKKIEDKVLSTGFSLLLVEKRQAKAYTQN